MKTPFDISPAPREHLDIHFTTGHGGTSTRPSRDKRCGRLLSGLLGLICAMLPVLAQAQSFEVLFSDNVGRNPEAGLVKGSDGDFYGTTYEGGASNRGTVFKMTSAGVLTTLHSFNTTNGSNPRAGLVQGSDGDFYGTTDSGGVSGVGTVFKITSAGVLTMLHSFNSTNGSHPYAGLVQGTDGDFYGTTQSGGASGYGTVFKITTAGVLTTLHAFDGANGRYSRAGLVQGSDGDFYGTTPGGGASGAGTVFKITSARVFTTLYSFTAPSGSGPQAGLVQGSDGDFYGTTVGGGPSEYGTVFKMTSSGVLTTLHFFDYSNGGSPFAGLVQGSDGAFYGTTAVGGVTDAGTVFKITSSGMLTTLHSFNNTNGDDPRGGLVQGSGGDFYGTTVSGGAINIGTVFKITSAGAHTMLHNFDYSNGGYPAGLTQGSDGYFYGTTYGGGASSRGTVFKITPPGVLTTLHSFNGTDGLSPQAGLVEGSDGDFYGTTPGDGGSSQGTVFKITSAGVLTTLHTFNGTDGRSLYAGLVEGSDGDFYGTTYGDGGSNRGTVFKITPAGFLTTLHSFNGTNGSGPQAGLVQSSDGDFYGTTGAGGASNRGTVFKITSAGVLTTLHSFNGTNGSSPVAALVQSRDGDFYGTTLGGGASGAGTVFKITSAGVLTTLHSFNTTNGFRPEAGLVQGSDGDFYGTTLNGGANGYGAVFKISASGTYTLLHSFDFSPAAFPSGTPTFGTDGHLYGTAHAMVVWKLTLAPSVTAISPTSGSTLGGTSVIIAGTGFTGATSVTFGGANATSFTVDSATHITASTPAHAAGAVSVEVTTPGGTNTANTLFTYITPEIVVHDGSHSLAPQLSDGQVSVVSFGSTAPNVASVRSFLVRNTGDADLTISNITTPSGYITNGGATVLAPGTTYGFQVALSSATPASYSGSVVINSDDLNEAVFDFPVTGSVVAPGSAPVVNVGSDIAVQGATGSAVPGGPVGSTLYKFIGSPALNPSGVLASAVQIRHADASLHTGMMVGQPLVLIATDTQVAPSLPGVNHHNFGPPVINETGHIAFIGEVRGAGITTNVNSRCLFSNSSDGTLKLVAQVGTSAGLGSNLKTIGNFSIGGDLVIFLGTLVDKSVVLFGWDANTGLRPFVRNGQTLSANGVNKTVQSFAVLETGNASSGHGKELSVAPTGESLVTFSVAFTDGTSGVVVGSFDGTSDTGFGATYGASQQLVDTYATPPAIPLAKWNTFRSPGFDNTGNYYGFISQMVTSAPAGVSSTNNVGIFVDTAPGVLTLQLRENDAATGTTGLVFSDFSDLVLGGGDYEFLVKGELRGTGVVANVNDKGLWAQHATNGLVLVAREGSEAPGVAGSTFLRLTQIALPGTAQPLFQATMTAGVGGVTTADDTGLWVVNASHNTVLAVREGDVISVGGTPRAVTAITALLNGTTTGGALGRRVFLADGQLTLLLTFSGGVQANAKVVVP
jgi:uncharacterized repeat protein (TIGR03803 family)